MRLNKKGKPYQEPDQPKPSVIMDAAGNYYHATKAPEGFCRCGIMMALQPKQNKYVFPTAVSARHAIAHTMSYLKSINVEFNPKDYYVKAA